MLIDLAVLAVLQRKEAARAGVWRQPGKSQRIAVRDFGANAFPGGRALSTLLREGRIGSP